MITEELFDCHPAVITGTLGQKAEQRFYIKIKRRHTVYLDLSRCWMIECQQTAKYCSFARTIRSDKSKDFTGIDFKGCIINGFNFAATIHLSEILYCN